MDLPTWADVQGVFNLVVCLFLVLGAILAVVLIIGVIHWAIDKWF